MLAWFFAVDGLVLGQGSFGFLAWLIWFSTCVIRVAGVEEAEWDVMPVGLKWLRGAVGCGLRYRPDGVILSSLCLFDCVLT